MFELLLIAFGVGFLAKEKPASKRYDNLFRRRCSALPLAFVRALAKHESNFNPKLFHPTGSKATGILQVAEVVRTSYNSAKGTALVQDDLFDPEINVQVACWLIGRIVAGYAKHPSLAPDWTSRRWVELLVLGWNAGYSEGAGVGYVVGVLEARGVPTSQITVDAVYAAALNDAKATSQLRKSAKIGYSKSVADTYFRELLS